jgi:transcriptional regulator with XRE-family HTH domain
MTDGAGGPIVLRILLGTQLRRLREAKGITAQQAARTIRGSESKISRIELGRNAVREVDIGDLLTLYGVTDTAKREQLLSLASQANQPGWWHRYQDILPTWFQAYIGLEESAESIRSYDAQFIPGLLQTEDYASTVIALGDFSPEEAERLVYLRKERQRRFEAGGLRLWAIIDEVALRRLVGSVSLMRAQLEHLSDLSERPGLTLQITPFPAGSHTAPGSFSILHFGAADLPNVVYLEQLTSAMYLDKRSDVDRYTEALDKLSAKSATPSESRKILRGWVEEMEGSP